MPDDGPRPPLPAALVDPHPGRLAPGAPGHDAIVARHRAVCDAGEDGYVDPVSGRWVFSAVYLWRRGTCCDSGCRHCPYVERPPDVGHTMGGPDGT